MLEFFTQFPELIVIMSEKEDGSMKIFKDGEIGDINQKNRQIFFEKSGINDNAVISANLVHGNHVEVVAGVDIKIIPETDALITKESKILLAVTIADCVPVFFYEKERGIIALAHAGWRGVVGNILKNTVEEISKIGGDVNNLYVALGPGINECHFEIKEDVLGMFANYSESIVKRDGKIFVNLKGIIIKQLIGLGIKEVNIENNETCTFEAENLFSYRRSNAQSSDSMIALIGFKSA